MIDVSGKARGTVSSAPCFSVVNGRKLLLDRTDDVCRRDGIEVKGGAYRRRFGFESERFVNGDGYELLKKQGESGRGDLFHQRRVSGGGLAIWTGRRHAVRGFLRAVVRFAPNTRVKRLKYGRGERYAQFTVCAPRPTHQSPILVYAVFAEWKNALVKRLREKPLSQGPNVPNGVKCTHIFYKSRTGVATRRWKVDRWGECVLRGIHQDVCGRWGDHAGHVSVLYRARLGGLPSSGPSGRKRQRRNVGATRNIPKCRKRRLGRLAFPTVPSKNQINQDRMAYKTTSFALYPPPTPPTVLPVRQYLRPPLFCLLT